MKQFIAQYWVECLFSGALFVLSYIAKITFAKVKRLSLVENGMQALLRDRIIHSYNEYMKKGYCPIYGLENINHMYENYHALGGNGTITRLVSELEKLPRERREDDNYEAKHSKSY